MIKIAVGQVWEGGGRRFAVVELIKHSWSPVTVVVVEDIETGVRAQMNADCLRGHPYEPGTPQGHHDPRYRCVVAADSGRP